jgi:hypothetical protein
MYAQQTMLDLTTEHRNDMLADARQQRPAQLQRAFLRASRRAGRAQRRMDRAYRTVARLDAGL